MLPMNIITLDNHPDLIAVIDARQDLRAAAHAPPHIAEGVLRPLVLSRVQGYKANPHFAF